MKVYVDFDVNEFKRLEKELLKLEDKGKKYLSDAVNKAGDFTQRKIKSSLPLNDKPDNIHLRN